MTFGIARGVAQDAAGNVQTNVWIEVRRMAPGFPLAVPIYADADGATGQDNPFFSASGEFAFYAVGGLYRVRVYRAGFDKTWDNVPVGTAQAADVDAYARAGFTWAPESATGTPPTAGCIRFDNADISLAQHVYLDKDTLGGSDASSWLNSMAPGDWLLLSTGVGIETGWQVVAITDHTGWFDFEVDDGSYAGPAGPLSFGDSGFVTVSQQRNGSIDAGTGVLVQTGPNAYVARTITGTANEVVVANGSGVAGNPTLSLPAALTFTGKTVTGGTFASPTAITGLPDPTNAQDAATKSYVDNLAAGLDIKGSARAATTANITLSGAQTIDGVSVVAGERVLVKNQSTASQNGIYVVAAGAWARSGDMNAWTEVPGATLWVEEGSTLADTAWVCTSNAGGTIGSTAIIWTQFGGTGAFQGLNANLTAIAGLTTAADKLSYWTGAGTAGLTDLSSFARTLLDDANAGAARTTLGVAIGSDVQGYNSQLANIAAVTPAQGDLLYYNGAAWVKLAAGTSGNFLKTQGIGANPAWASIPGGGDMLAANNLSDLTSKPTAQKNLGVREVLTGARTYYVRTDGSDANTGLANTSGGAFLTIQKAIDTVASLDISGNAVTIQIADGTYTGTVNLANVVGFAVHGNLVVQGNNSTPANVIISPTANDAFKADSLSVSWQINDLKVQTTTSGNGLHAKNGSKIKFQNIVFGACASQQINCENAAVVEATGNYAISGGAVSHIAQTYGSIVYVANRTVTLSGTPAFTRFVYSDVVGSVSIFNMTFSGSATGARYVVADNAVIFTNGGGANYLPGNSAGSASNGGLYA